MRRSTKWTIIIAVFCLIVIAIGLVVYFSVFHKDAYHVAAVGDTTYQASDFKGSELKLYKNGTFHINIVYDGSQLFFLGVGTYTKQNGAYILQFTQAVGRQDGIVKDQMAQFAAPLTCQRSGNRIIFSDHNKQTYYFG